MTTGIRNIAARLCQEPIFQPQTPDFVERERERERESLSAGEAEEELEKRRQGDKENGRRVEGRL